jgi:Zn-dependent metalloprotease
MYHKKFNTRKNNVLVAVLAGFALTSSAAAQVALPTPEFTDLQLDPKNVTEDLPDAEKAQVIEKAFKKLEQPFGRANKLKVKNPRQELTAVRVSKDKANKIHVRFKQTYKGIPVKDGDLAFHDDESDPSADPIFRGSYLEDIDVDPKPKISKQKAIAIVESLAEVEVRKQGSKVEFPGEQPDKSLEVKHRSVESDAFLEIHPGKGPGKRALTYHVSVKNFSGQTPVILEAWVDDDGNVLEQYDNVQTACSAGVGRTFYQGLPTYFKIAYWPAVARYVLNDNCLRIGTYDMFNTTGTVYQAASYSSIFGNYALSDRNSTNADTHHSTVQTYSFYYYVLGRTKWIDNNYGPKVYASVDGLGALISARNHAGNKYNNAYWDGKQITLGDGDGVNFRSFATLDIIGHEWTHGLTQYVAGLKYLNESGALNESFSDIFGAMAERYWKGESSNTWKLAEQAFTPAIGGDAMRYMDRPTLDGQSRDHYSQRYIGTWDNGGVHINSGIQNNAFYLLAKGGCHRFAGCMAGAIGANAATQIYWRALRDYIISTDNFSWARQCTLWAAADLYGKYSFNWYRTRQAWDLVGVPKVID